MFILYLHLHFYPCISISVSVSPGKEEGVITMDQKFWISLKAVSQKRLSYTVVTNNPQN